MSVCLGGDIDLVVRFQRLLLLHFVCGGSDRCKFPEALHTLLWPGVTFNPWFNCVIENVIIWSETFVFNSSSMMRRLCGKWVIYTTLFLILSKSAIPAHHYPRDPFKLHYKWHYKAKWETPEGWEISITSAFTQSTENITFYIGLLVGLGLKMSNDD